MEPSRFFCFGLGFTGLTLARQLKNAGWAVGGTCRTKEKIKKLRAQGFDAFLFDGESSAKEIETFIQKADFILVTIPPQSFGDPILNHFGSDIAENVKLKWLGYISTTGVYGDHKGGVVDESSKCDPTTDRSKRRLEVEKKWFQFCEHSGIPLHVFRSVGIYGPGRNPLETVKQGKAKRIHKPGHAYSRIHVEDFAQILCASMNSPNSGAIYNVSDDKPASPSDVVAYACELLKVEPPPLVDFEKADLSEMARSFYLDNKRIANSKIKEELGIQLKFPDYRVGLNALAKAIKHMK